MIKPKTNIYVYFLWFLVMTISSSFAQETIKKDTSNINVSYFKDNIKERYSESSFNYSINDTGGVNLMQRILRNFFNWLGDVFGFEIDVDYQILEYIVYGLLGIVALYLIVSFLLQAPVRSVFKTDGQSIDNFKYVEDNLEKVDFDTLINEAIKDKNYRLATRYLYLKSLKLLTSKNIIEWHYDKTTNEYLNEIKDQNAKRFFKRISYIYDYVWYGEFPLDELIFEKHKVAFAQINTLSNG